MSRSGDIYLANQITAFQILMCKTIIFLDPFVSTERLICTAQEMESAEMHTNGVSNYSNASERNKISSMSLAIPYMNKCDHIQWI